MSLWRLSTKNHLQIMRNSRGRAVSTRLHTDGAAAELIWTQASQPAAAAAVAANVATRRFVKRLDNAVINRLSLIIGLHFKVVIIPANCQHLLMA